MTGHGWALVLALVFLLFQFPPGDARSAHAPAKDFGGLLEREDLAAAGNLRGAQLVVRFVQVSDAHIVDDDAPYPLRQEPLDRVGSPFTAAQRPQEEFTDEVLNRIVARINSIHGERGLDFVLNTGDNIDNELENELMRFIDNWDGTQTRRGPVSGLPCLADGQAPHPDDTSHDVVFHCTSLPTSLEGAANVPLAPGVPWYSAFGNHDGLIQGNAPKEPGFDGVARQFGRHFVNQLEYVGMHFSGAAQCAAGTPAGNLADDFGHGYGFARERLCDEDPDNDGYYSFTLRGVRFVVLDTVNDDFVTANEHLNGLFNPEAALGYDVLGGYAEGSVDPDQFAWLEEQLASHPQELVLVFAHHTVHSMFLEPASSQCLGNECLEDLLQEAGYKTAEDVIALLADHPNTVAFIGGHTHQHRIAPWTVAGAASPGFWNVETASLIDLPQEARVVELWKTPEGKGFLALRDFGHDFEPSRALAAADPQWDADEARGRPEDRDVILWFDVPPGVRFERS